MSDVTGLAKVFISHAAEDRKLALDLRDQLFARGISAWAYEKAHSYGSPIRSTVEEHLKSSDHFLVVLSPHAKASEWVARELNHALELREHRKRLGRPQIIAVCGEGFDFATHSSIKLRAFDDGTDLKRTYDFEPSRLFDPAKEPIDTLAEQLQVQIRFIESIDGEDGRYLRRSFDCYEALFPDERERDATDDIISWIDSSAHAIRDGSPWKNLYGILHIGSQCVGMAFLSHHLERHWCFGNYFGVIAGWRQYSRGEQFYSALAGELAKLDPLWKGILFEVEPISQQSLQIISEVGVPKCIKNSETSQGVVRCLRRIALYTRNRALALVDEEGRPCQYWQPAMSDPIRRANEVELMLMALLRPGTPPPNVREVLDYVYDDLFGDAYGDGGDGADVSIPHYREYVAGVKARVLALGAAGGRFAPLRLDKVARQVLREVRRAMSDSDGDDDALSQQIAL